MQFPYEEGRIPKYANATLVNPLADGVLLDFGFVDPLQLNAMEAKGLQTEDKLLLEVQPLERFAVSRVVAEQLFQQLAQVLGVQEEQSNDWP